MIAHKFGGSSLANAERIAHVVDVLLARTGDGTQVVVVSAMQGVTDALLALVVKAAAGDETWRNDVETLATRHRAVAETLLETPTGLLATFDDEFRALTALLDAQAKIGAVSSDLRDLISGLGEVWSSRIVHALFVARGAAATARLDARDVLEVTTSDLGAHVDWERSEGRLAAWREQQAPFARVVVTGFVARSAGRITTLGRNGSDYSGAIFAALFGAKELHLWSDVVGVLSADPRLVPEAVLIPDLSYSEACELAYFGAKVVHPQTMAPAIARQIPIFARSTFTPEHPGTRIGNRHEPAAAQDAVKGVTTFSGLAILNIEGAGMIGVPGTAERAFQALKQSGVSVVMISQGSSEHSICCVVRAEQAEHARVAVSEAFRRELDARQLSDVALTGEIAALAVVGDGMAGTPGIAARLFGALRKANVNVRVIAQGASERNISVAIDAKDATRALRAVHAAFYLSAHTISVGVLGPGNVGRAVLRQLAATRKRLLSQGIDLRVRAIGGRQAMLLGEQVLPDDGQMPELTTGAGGASGSGPSVSSRDDAVASKFAGGREQTGPQSPRSPLPTDLAAFADHVQSAHIPHAVILDCTSTGEAPSHYAEWLARGIHVITPNKQAGSGPLARYKQVRNTRNPGLFKYESTVGAGLPVITTLRDLLDTGDEVLSIAGIFSGTLAYLFNRYDGSVPFSALVREAKELGYTEPDPRDDLSGLDVARKLVILARERGDAMTLEQVALESLVPEALRDVPRDEFLARLSELDGPLEERFQAAQTRGEVLRYVARLGGPMEASVGLVALPADHAFAHIRLTDNIVQFTTDRYRANPLVVQGPGAGPEVTAAGVFADLLRVAAATGAATAVR